MRQPAGTRLATAGRAATLLEVIKSPALMSRTAKAGWGRFEIALGAKIDDGRVNAAVAVADTISPAPIERVATSALVVAVSRARCDCSCAALKKNTKAANAARVATTWRCLAWSRHSFAYCSLSREISFIAAGLFASANLANVCDFEKRRMVQRCVPGECRECYVSFAIISQSCLPANLPACSLVQVPARRKAHLLANSLANSLARSRGLSLLQKMIHRLNYP